MIVLYREEEMRQQNILLFILVQVVLMACISKPPPWRPDGWLEVTKEVFLDVNEIKVVDQFEVKYDMTALELKEVETKDFIAVGDEYDASDQGEVELIDLVAELLDQKTQKDLEILDYFGELDQFEEEVIECPQGYQYDPEAGECVSFCPADKYYEDKLGQCFFYPCCDLNAQWSVSVMDTETSSFTVYQVKLNQQVAYLQGELTLTSPSEIANCVGYLQKKEFALTCQNAQYSLLLTSETTSEDEVFGFYSYSFTDGTFQNGPFNMSK